MKQTKDPTSPVTGDEADIFLALAEKKINLTYALDICAHIGKILQRTEKLEKETAIAALCYEATNLVNQRDLTGAMMILQVTNAWESG